MQKISQTKKKLSEEDKVAAAVALIKKNAFEQVPTHGVYESHIGSTVARHHIVKTGLIAFDGSLPHLTKKQITD